MLQFMHIGSEIFDWLALRVAVIILAVLTACCILQISTRILGSSYTWTEELARYCFIWMNLLGATVLVKSKEHAVIDLLSKRLSGTIKHLNSLSVNILILVAGGVLIVKGTTLTFAVIKQASPSLHIPMYFVYAAAPVCGFGICLHTVLNIVSTLEEWRGKATKQV